MLNDYFALLPAIEGSLEGINHGFGKHFAENHPSAGFFVLGN